MKDSVLLAIDQGTTGSTALLVDAAGAVRARGYCEFPQHFPRPGRVEHDPDEIWDSVQRAVAAALAAADLPPASVAALGLTNQRETTLLWDRATGRPLARAIVWQDRRTAERCAALREAGHAPHIRRRTGLVVDPYFSATKVEWLLRRLSGVRAAARRGRVAFGTIDAWLVWKLTGGAVHATDPTNASRTMLYDIARRRWDEGLCDLFGVPRALLPEVVPSCGVLGATRGAAPLPDGIPIAGIAGDQQAALFGQGCVAAGQSKNTYGTGAFLMLHTGAKPFASRAGLVATLACGPAGEPAYALEGSVFVAGAALQWLRDGLSILLSAADSDALARSVPDTGGVVLVPAFTGLGAPHWRADVRGALFGLTRGTTRAHVVRAALEALAFQTKDLIDAMARDVSGPAGRGAMRGGAAKRPIRELRVDGGAAANDFLMQYQADVLGVPLVRPAVFETTALGAALLAGLGVGFWRGQGDLACARRVERRFEPARSAAWRAREYARWRAAVDTLLRRAER